VKNDVSRISHLAIVVALAAAAVVSSVWYSPFLFGKQWVELRNANSVGVADWAMPAWKIAVDLVREFVVVYVLARLINGLGIVDWKGALSLGFCVWLGFPVQMLVGASLGPEGAWHKHDATRASHIA
jgi:hypothetical protein